MISTVELMDRFQVLLNQEASVYHHKDYLSPSTLPVDSPILYTRTFYEAKDLSEQKIYWRSKLCAWMYYVVDSHDLDREMVAIAMSYMDRYLSESKINDSSGYQLVGMTSLYISVKIFRHNGKCAGVSSFVKLSKGVFFEHDFLNMEQDILQTLGWRMHPPTTLAYLELLMMFLPRKACTTGTRRALYERIKFLLELSVTVQFFFGKKPSTIAIAAFIEVMEHDEEPHVAEIKYQAHFRKCVRSITGVDCSSEEVIECRDAMEAVHRNAWYDINGDGAIEKDCAVSSPVGSKICVSVVSP